jgi:opacity protein-like surface antigen
MKRTAIAAALSLIACTAFAENDAAEWRVGGSLAFSEFERDDRLVDDGGQGFKLHAQYRFNSWFGAECAYYVSPDFSDDLTPLVGGGEVETSYSGATVHAIAYIPMPGERIDVYGKAGYYSFFDIDLSIDGVNTDTGSNDGMALGAGASVRATQQIGIRAEFDWYDLSAADLWTLSLGVEYRF